MNVFTEVYEKSIDLLKTKSFDDSWKTIESDLKTLLQVDGPDASKAEVLVSLRTQLNKAAKGKGVAAVAMADEIVKASKDGAAGYQERAALIKTMAHFYMVQRKGNQSIWVVDQPKAFTKWGYDLMGGKSTPELKGERLKMRLQRLRQASQQRKKSWKKAQNDASRESTRLSATAFATKPFAGHALAASSKTVELSQPSMWRLAKSCGRCSSTRPCTTRRKKLTCKTSSSQSSNSAATANRCM